MFRCRSRQVAWVVLGGFSLAVAAVWVVLAFSLSGVAARVLLTVVFVALAGGLLLVPGVSGGAQLACRGA